MKTLNEITLNKLLNIDDAYVLETLKERLPTNLGSVFDWAVDVKDICHKLKHATWVKDNKVSLLPRTTAFTSNVPGLLGIVELSSLEHDVVVTLDDKELTGKFIPVVTGVARVPVNHTVLIVGPSDENPSKTVMWAVHPGNPVHKSVLPVNSNLTHGSQITVSQALELGMEWAKIE